MNTLILILMLSQYNPLPPYTGNENFSTWQWDAYQQQERQRRQDQDRLEQYRHDFETERLLREQNNILRNQLPNNNQWNWKK